MIPLSALAALPSFFQPEAHCRIRNVAARTFLVFFSVFAVAQISAPNCTETSYAWAFNSAGQSPCTVIAYMMGTCDGGLYALSPLQPGYKYYGPQGPDNSNLCECSTVGYSLFSACVACQGETWITWSTWRTNCTKVLPPGSFPNPVPSGIRVPQWALIDITNENLWNPNKSYSVGDDPELVPGVIIGPSSVSAAPTSSSTASSSTSTSSTSPTISPTTPILVSHSSNSGAIAGGVVGGIAVISIAVAAVLLYLRRRPRAPSAEFLDPGASQPYMDDASRPLSEGGTVAPSSSSGSPLTMKFYDPNDPTTFPGYTGPQSLDMPPQGSTSSQIGYGSNLPTTQTSSQGPTGYHGFPIPV